MATYIYFIVIAYFFVTYNLHFGQSLPLNKEDKKPQIGESIKLNNPYQGNFNLEKITKYRVREGDILYENQEDTRKRRAVSTIERHKWDNGVVPYAFDTETGKVLADDVKLLIVQSMEHISNLTCIQFVPRTNEINYVLFTRGAGCASFIGNVRFGERGNLGGQDISIGDSCHVQGVIVHEILHALGFIHEHTRPDRNNYIFVNYTNVRTGLESQFEIYTSSSPELEISTLDTGYDKGSVMHYDRFTFTNKADENNIVKFRQEFMTMYSLTNWRDELGNRNGLSSMDTFRVNQHYNCPQAATTTTTTTTTTPTTTTTTTTPTTTTTTTPTTTTPTTTASTTTTTTTPTTTASTTTKGTATSTTASSTTKSSSESSIVQSSTTPSISVTTRSTTTGIDTATKKGSSAVTYRQNHFILFPIAFTVSLLTYFSFV